MEDAIKLFCTFITNGVLKKEGVQIGMKRAILDALEAKYNADIAHADATLKIYLENSVGIGEHPQHIEECDKLVYKIAEAQGKLDVLKQFEPEKL